MSVNAVLLCQAHNKSIASLVMLSEGTLLSGGERDRKIVAWDSLQNYKKITETKVQTLCPGDPIDVLTHLVHLSPDFQNYDYEK